MTMIEPVGLGLPAPQLIEELSGAIDAGFADAIPDGPVSLVDFPDHSNVGDSAIWLGEMAWLDAQDRTPAYVAGLKDFAVDELNAAAPEGPILIHGGGNFGTVWPRHEELRVLLLQSFKGRPIVQLPQSIHYDDMAKVTTTAKAIAAHGAFTLLVRDKKSFDLATAHFDCKVALCPDAAFRIGRLKRHNPRADILALLRTDHENVPDETPAPPGTIATDWLDESSRDRAMARARVKLGGMLASDEQARRLQRQRLLADWRLKRGIRILSQGRVVVTDRLHAHIIALLLDIPHVALDNHYGKVGAFIDQWTRRYRSFRQATRRAEGYDLARQLLGDA